MGNKWWQAEQLSRDSTAHDHYDACAPFGLPYSAQGARICGVTNGGSREHREIGGVECIDWGPSSNGTILLSKQGSCVLKIWRYVDFAKFMHMLATGTLYFPCVTELKDPYEGWMPRSHIKALTEMNRGILDRMERAYHDILAQLPATARDRVPVDAIIADARRKLDLQSVLPEVNRKFGVSCWHVNEHESEAMWQLYSAAGQGIAIESTKARLEGALKGDGIHVDRVRYMNFDTDEIEKGHRNYGLFLKRKSFEHEQELRATILLPAPGTGTAVPCDLKALIVQIQFSLRPRPITSRPSNTRWGRLGWRSQHPLRSQGCWTHQTTKKPVSDKIRGRRRYRRFSVRHIIGLRAAGARSKCRPSANQR